MAKKQKKLPVRDLLEKVEYEGGAFAAFVIYGLDPADYDLYEEDRDELERAVVALADANRRLTAIMDSLEAQVAAEDTEEQEEADEDVNRYMDERKERGLRGD